MWFRHSAHLFVKTDDIDFHDSPQPKIHVMKSEVGNDMERAWCDECGCGIWIRPGTKPGMTFLKAGTSLSHCQVTMRMIYEETGEDACVCSERMLIVMCL